VPPQNRRFGGAVVDSAVAVSSMLSEAGSLLQWQISALLLSARPVSSSDGCLNVAAAAGVCRSGEQVVSTVKSKLKPTLLANWTVWPLAHVINFALVPPAQRILYINVLNVSGCHATLADVFERMVLSVQPVLCAHVICGFSVQACFQRTWLSECNAFHCCAADWFVPACFCRLRGLHSCPTWQATAVRRTQPTPSRHSCRSKQLQQASR
jgi:hypothetical protein